VAFRVRQVFRRLEIPGCISYPHEWTCILAVPGMRLVSPSPCWPPHPRVWRPWTYQARMPLGPIRGVLTPAQSCGRVMQPSNGAIKSKDAGGGQKGKKRRKNEGKSGFR